MMTQYWLGNFAIFQGILPSIAEKPYIFVIYEGGVSEPLLPPPLDPRVDYGIFWWVSLDLSATRLEDSLCYK